MESAIKLEYDALDEALADFDKDGCPCTGCPNLKRCQKSDIACEAFYIYSNSDNSSYRGSGSREPTRAIFRAIFRAKDGPTNSHPMGYRPRATEQQIWLAEGMLREGNTIEETARACHLGKCTVGKIKRGLGI